MIKYVVLFLVIFWGSLAAQQRGIWIVRNSLNTVQDLKQLAHIHQKIGLTDVYLQVRALGLNVYEQPVKYRLSLDEIVTFCHERNIKVHGWINVLYIWSQKKQPISPTHPFNIEKEHIMTDVQSEWPDLQRLRAKGVEGYFLDPGAFVNLNQIKKLITTLINEKRFDGIHLDYLRYPGGGFIFSKYLRTKFMKKYYVDPRALFTNLSSLFQVQQEYQNFLLNELNNYVENLHNMVKTLNETCALSVAVKPDLGLARSKYYQDWLSWLKDSNCDYVLMMNYTPDDLDFNKNLVNAEHTAFAQNIVCGIGAYYLDSKKLDQRIHIVENSKLKGYALFSFTTIKEQPEILSLVNINN